MGLSRAILAALKVEVQTDPYNRGYAGKTRAQQLALLNESFTVTETIEVTREMPSRLHSIIAGVAFAPNMLDLQDLQDAING